MTFRGKALNATHNRLPPGGRSIDKPIHSGVELNQRTFLDPSPVGKRDASREKACLKLALWPFRQILVTLHER